MEYFIIFTFVSIFIYFLFLRWQHSMIFSPVCYRESHLNEMCKLLSLETSDKVELEGVVYEPKVVKSTIIYFGGRSQDAVGLIEPLSKNFSDFRIVTFNYRSYGKSEGKVNEKNIFNDALEVTNLVKKEYGDFYLVGFSLGSSVAAFVGSQIKTSSIFLLGAFDSMASLALKKYFFTTLFNETHLEVLLKYSFRTKEHVQSIDELIHLFVSKNDQVTYIDNARNLKAHIPNLGLYIEYDDLDHKDILWDFRVIEKMKEQMK